MKRPQSRQKFRPSRWLIAAAVVLGLLVGGGGAWIALRAPGPIQLRVLNGQAPTSEIRRVVDQHLVRSYVVTGNITDLTDRLRTELAPQEGWQPPITRSVNPRTIQFVRIHQPDNDFQFVRVTITDLSDEKVQVEIDEGPRQRNAFR